MKKVVKGLVIAASVAAVVGLGAVSFAKWAGNSNSQATTTGATDTISLIGFETASVTGFTGLQPYNQNDSNTTIEAVAKTVALPAVSTNGTETYDILLKADAALGLQTDSKLYVKLATSAPSEVIYQDAFITTNLTEANGWYEVGTSDKTVISNSSETGAYTAYFLLVSESSLDMGKLWNFTLTAQAHS